MRTFTYFLIILAIVVSLAYYQDKWLPPIVDFILQKSTPTMNISDDPDYQLYTKYKSTSTSSEPYEQCYIQCATDGYAGFKYCTRSSRCESFK